MQAPTTANSPCTFDHFTEYGIDRHSIAPALRQLVALKFIEITEHGRAGNAEYRRPNLFRLTYRPVDRAKATDEWRTIKTEEEARMLARLARKTTGQKHSPVGIGLRSGASGGEGKSGWGYLSCSEGPAKEID